MCQQCRFIAGQMLAIVLPAGAETFERAHPDKPNAVATLAILAAIAQRSAPLPGAQSTPESINESSKSIHADVLAPALSTTLTLAAKGAYHLRFMLGTIEKMIVNEIARRACDGDGEAATYLLTNPEGIETLAEVQADVEA